jgi:hypothetical protein
MRWDAAGGATTILGAVAVADEDRDLETTEAVKAALAQNDPQRAEQILDDAQKTEIKTKVAADEKTPDKAAASSDTPAAPSAQPAADHPKPQLTEGLRQEILRGDTEFFHIYLFDTCDEDGDVVEILLNDVPFGIVPITNAGTTLSVPVSASGSTRIAIKGIRDGVGGITTGCWTSKGQGFVRVLAPGEVQELGIVRK